MSTCTCYRCDGTGETADGYDSTWGDARTSTCRHCGGSGQEPERDDEQPDPSRATLQTEATNE